MAGVAQVDGRGVVELLGIAAAQHDQIVVERAQQREEMQHDLMALPGVGMSILEISHRSKAFDAIIQGCEADIRKLANISSDYQILFLQGGASLQFSMVPINLLPAGGARKIVGPK